MDLKTLTEGNGAFSSHTPGLQLYWDSVSLGALKQCPRKYQYEIIEGYSSSNIHLQFGIAYHSALEAFDRQLAATGDFASAQRAAVRFALEWVERDDDGWTEIPSDVPVKTRETLVRAVVWYTENYRNDALVPILLDNGTPAVELSFRFPTEWTTEAGETYFFCGHIDKLVEYGQQAYFLDRKTTKGSLSAYYFAGYSPDNQMSLYDFAGRVIYQQPLVGGIIDAAQLLTNSVRFARGFVHRTKSQALEWYEMQRWWLDQAEFYAVTEFWPMNDKACGLFGGCPFREVCSKDERVRHTFLAKFDRRSWDPTEVR